MLTRSFLLEPPMQSFTSSLRLAIENTSSSQQEEEMSVSTPTGFTFRATKAKSGTLHMFSKKRSQQSHS